ncbi:MAG TPA: hypothetical protein PKB10_04340, partial [Tepidisphaeraceae bacterium]|nr:hypothetical protein [Tepidisphaeraceae bacterium]
MRCTAHRLLLVALLGLLALHPVAFGQERGRANRDADNRANGVPPPIDRSASLNARRELEAARIALFRAESSLNSTMLSVDRELRTANPYTDAIRNLRVAQREYDRARLAVRDELKYDPYYRDDRARKHAAQQEIARLVESGTITFDAVAPMATAAMRAGMRMTTAETIAYATEPSVEDARQRMLHAAAVVRQLNDAARAAAPSDPRVRDARQDLASAKDRLDRANRSLAEALRREAQLERARAETMWRAVGVEAPAEAALTAAARGPPRGVDLDDPGVEGALAGPGGGGG